jgi:hypothetical protein
MSMIASERIGTRQLCHLIGAQPAARIAIASPPITPGAVDEIAGSGLHFRDFMIVSPRFRAQLTKRREPSRTLGIF